MNANSCKNNGLEDLIVSYIYDEATADERRRLEKHILDCSSCMEDFAGLSNARLSVFEWQKEDFAPLATPAFTLPDAPRPLIREPQEKESYIERLQAFVSGLRGPALAFGAVLLLLAGGLGFVLISNSGTSGPTIVSNPAAASKPEQPERAAVEPPAAAVASEKREELESRVAPASEIRELKAEMKITKAAARTRATQPARNLTAKAERPRRTQSAGQKAPSLSDFDEPARRSLMLSDLFDDQVGSIY